jgi:hypothetical protein
MFHWNWFMEDGYFGGKLVINMVINKCNDYWFFYKSSKELTHISKNWQDPYGLYIYIYIYIILFLKKNLITYMDD